jgi:aspartate 1-decarboxylase
MTNTENDFAPLFVNDSSLYGKVTLTSYENVYCWRNENGGRVSTYFTTVAKALAFPPK